MGISKEKSWEFFPSKIIELTLKEYKIKIVKKNVLIKIINQPFDDNYFYSLQQNYV